MSKMPYKGPVHFNWPDFSPLEAMAMLLAGAEEERIKQALIGATITDFKMTPIKGRKRMFLLEIKTNAQPLESVMDSHVKICVNELRFKVKL